VPNGEANDCTSLVACHALPDVVVASVGKIREAEPDALRNAHISLTLFAILKDLYVSHVRPRKGRIDCDGPIERSA
jgi:hypothetical protein